MTSFSFHCEYQNKVGLGFTSLKMLKQSKAGDLFHWKGQNLVGLGIYFIKKKCQNKVRLLHWKCWSKVRLEICFIEKAKIRYSWDLIYWIGQNIENIEMSAPGDLFHWKWWNKVWLRIYVIDKKFTSLELQK